MSSRRPHQSSQQQDHRFSRNYPMDRETGRGSCLVLPGTQRRKRREKVEDQRVSLLEEDSPTSASTRLTAWTPSTTETEEFPDMISEDPFEAHRKKKNKESLQREREQEPRAVTPEALLMAPIPKEKRIRKSYEGEREPDGVRGQEAKVTKSKRKSKLPLPINHDAPTLRSFSEGDARKTSSLRLVSPKEQAAAAGRRYHRPEINSPDSDEDSIEDEDARSPRLALLPVSETSIPEGVEEASTDADESSGDKQLAMRSFVPEKSKVESVDYSPQDVRDFPHSTDIRKLMHGSKSHSVSPPTPRMRKLPDDMPKRSSSVQQLVSKSQSSDADLREMMPDLKPTPQSSVASTRGRSNIGSSDNGMHSRTPLSPSNDSNEANVINSLENIEMMNGDSVELVEHGEYDLALAGFERVLVAYKEIYGEAHPLVASTYHNLGMVHSKRAALLLDGTFHQNHCRQQSLECFQAAARTGRDSLGPNHPNVAVSLVRIGFLLLQARQYQNAFVTFKEALRIRLAHYGKETPHSLVANLYNNLGVCKMHMGQYKEGSSLLKTALDIQRKVLRIKRQEQTVLRSELRNCLLEIADTLCNLGGLHLEWIRQRGPDPRNAAEAEAAFSEALEIRTIVLGSQHELVHQVRTLHEMARTTPLPAPLLEIDSQIEHPSRRSRPRSRSRSPSASRSVSLSQCDEAESEPYQQREMLNGGSLDGLEDLDNAFLLQSSMASEGSQTRAVSNVSRRDDTFGSMPFVEATGDSLDQPSDENNSFTRTSPPDKVKDVSHISVDTQVRLASHFIPRTSEPVQSSRNAGHYEDGEHLLSPYWKRGSESATSHPPSQLMNGLRDLSLESAFARGRQEASAYFGEESCLIGDAGVDSDRATSLFLSMLTKEDSFRTVNSRTLSSHEITVLRTMEGGGFDSPVQGTSRKLGSMASFSRALAEQRRVSKVSGDGEFDRAGKPYYDSPTMQLDHNGSMYDRNPSALSDSVDAIPFADNGENGLAPLGGNWDTSKRSLKGKVLTKEMLDNPEDHLNKIYDAAGRYLKRNQYREALHLFQIILDTQRRTNGELDPDVGAAWHNIGVALLRSERHDKALEAFERAVRVRKGSLGKDHPEVAVSLVKVGITQLLLHDFEMALLSFRDALAVRRHSLGALHPSTARVYNNIGCVHLEFNELPQARRAFEAALDIQRNALSNEPTSGPLLFGTATTLCNLGYLYKIREMPERAALVLKEALELQEHLLGPNHPATLSTMGSVADAMAKSNDSVEALKHYNELLSRYRTIFKRDGGNKKRSGTEAILLFKMSRVHRNQKDFASELSDLQKALAVIRAIDDTSMSNDERTEIDQLAVLISEDIKRTKDALQKSEFNWL